MQSTVSAAKEARLAKFAIQCRKVRLFIAANPGTGNLGIRRALGFKPGRHISKMTGMGIIASSGFDGGHFVVPQ